MNTNKLLKDILGELMKEVRSNKELKDRITCLIEKQAGGSGTQPKRSRRRKPGPFDPMEAFRQRPDDLRKRLMDLDLEQLKDIVAEHGMDRAKLAMKWKSKDRLVDLIMTTVKSRATKGDAFRGDHKGHGNEATDNLSDPAAEPRDAAHSGDDAGSGGT